MKNILRLTFNDQFCSETEGVVFERHAGQNEVECGCEDIAEVYESDLMRCVTPENDACASFINYDGACVDECTPLSQSNGICHHSNGVYEKVGPNYELICPQNLFGDQCTPKCSANQSSYGNECYATQGQEPPLLPCNRTAKLIDHENKIMQLIDVCLEEGKTPFFDGQSYQWIDCPEPLGENNSCCSEAEILFVENQVARCIEYDREYGEFINCQYRTAAVMSNGSLGIYCLAYKSKPREDVEMNSAMLIAIYIVCTILILGVIIGLSVYLHRRTLDQRSPALFTDKYGNTHFSSAANLTSSEVCGGVVFQAE